MTACKRRAPGLPQKPKLTKYSYWLVFKKCKPRAEQSVSRRQGSTRTIPRKPLALVRVGGKSANTVAGDRTIAYDFDPKRNYRDKGAFTSGEPDILERPDLDFHLLGERHPCDPLLTGLMERLGPPVDGVEKRNRDSKRRRKANLVVVTEKDIAEMARLRANELSFQKIGDRLGFSRDTVRNYLGKNKPS